MRTTKLFQSRLSLVLSFALVLLVGYSILEGSPVQGNALKPRPELLVQPDSLAKNLNRSGWLVVDVRAYEKYKAGHILGAVHLPIEKLWQERNGIPGMLPSDAQLQQTIRQLGIKKETIVVAYDDATGLWASRLFWALDYGGQENGRLLDGGWNVWAGKGLPSSKEIVQPTPSQWTIKPHPERVASIEWVKEHLGDANTRLLDARSPGEYTGSEARSKRGGHIPGAININWVTHLNGDRSGRLQSSSELADSFRSQGINPDKEIVTYCQTNVRGSHSYFVMRLLGYQKVRGYDGSWAEWGNREDTPVVKGGQPGGAQITEKRTTLVASTSGLPQLDQNLAQVRAGLGEPDAVENANPCWGNKIVWIYHSSANRPNALRLIFEEGKLTGIN